MKLRATYFRPARSGFTMVEIAISLAIIGIALVAIIGVLPLGMTAQRDNREATIVNEDATIFMEAIRNGARGNDDLTNYVYAITNIQTLYSPSAQPPVFNGYNFSTYLNSGARIIGLLSTPKYQLASSGGGNFYSNHVVAYVRSISGPAVEKPPQDNPIIQQDSFGYRILCDNVPIQTAFNTNTFYNTQLAANLHELRLTFLWPQLPNGNLGGGHQTYRALIAGQIAQTNDAGNTLFFFQPQSFVNATNSP